MIEEQEALAQRARAVFEEEEERLSRARQAKRAAEKEAYRQAQWRFEQALLLLQERGGLPPEICSYISFDPQAPERLKLTLPEPFGCAHCSWTLHPRDDDLAAQQWYVSCSCKRMPANVVCNRAAWIGLESLGDLLLYQLEFSRRIHHEWQQKETEEAAARAELQRRQAEVVARACPWPPGTTVTVYQVHYVRGMARDEEGKLHWKEESGWSSLPKADAEGYLTLEPSMYHPERKLLKLDPELHRPVFQKHVFLLNELPLELTCWREEQISGFRQKESQGRTWLIRDPDGSVCFSFRVPLPWVKALAHHPPQNEEEQALS